MARNLTFKEKGFVKDIIKGETGTQAVLNYYDTEDENVAGAIASQNLGKLKIQNAIEEALPDKLLAQIHREGLFATKAAWEQDSDDAWINVGDEADFAVRHKYLDSAYKIKGKYVDPKPEKPSVTINVNVKQSEAESLRQEYEEKLKAKLLQ